MNTNNAAARPRNSLEAERHTMGWNAGYTGEAYPCEREADLAYARGYAEGLVARVEDAAEARQ